MLVIAKLVPLATSLMFLVFVPLPAIRVTNTVGAVPPVSKINPEGTFKIIVPVPISAVAPSEITEPVKEVYDPPAVSADIAEPPVAAVTAAVAETDSILPKNRERIEKTAVKILIAI